MDLTEVDIEADALAEISAGVRVSDRRRKSLAIVLTPIG